LLFAGIQVSENCHEQLTTFFKKLVSSLLNKWFFKTTEVVENHLITGMVQW